MKAQRYYEIQDGTAWVYDHPHKEHSVSVSIVPVKDLAYYRRTFKLEEVWSKDDDVNEWRESVWQDTATRDKAMNISVTN